VLSNAAVVELVEQVTPSYIGPRFDPALGQGIYPGRLQPPSLNRSLSNVYRMMPLPSW
jgi:hypothetical protein